MTRGTGWDLAEFSIVEQGESTAIVEVRLPSMPEGIPQITVRHYHLENNRVLGWEDIMWITISMEEAYELGLWS